MTRTRYRFSSDRQPHFLTSTIVAWLPVFTRREAVQIVLDSWTYLQEHQRLTLYGYVILENHLHWIATADDLCKEVGDFKSFTARRLIDLLESSGAKTLLDQLAYFKRKHKIDQDFQLWQEGSHPEAIDDEAMMLQKLEYIHDNPVKRGYVDDPLHWRYSSARNYAKQPGLIRVCTDW
jgi:putative transposase